MSKTTPEEAKALADKLRQVCDQVRGKSYPLADLIPLLQQTADFIDEVRGVDAEPVAHLYVYRHASLINSDVVEGFEVCRPHDIGADGRLAFPVYTRPAPSQPAATGYQQGEKHEQRGSHDELPAGQS